MDVIGEEEEEEFGGLTIPNASNQGGARHWPHQSVASAVSIAPTQITDFSLSESINVRNEGFNSGFGGVPRQLMVEEPADFFILGFVIMIIIRTIRTATQTIVPYYLYSMGFIDPDNYVLYCVTMAIPLLTSMFVHPIFNALTTWIGHRGLFMLLSVSQIGGALTMLLSQSFPSFLVGYVLLMTMTGEKTDMMRYIAHFTSNSPSVLKDKEDLMAKYCEIIGAFLGPSVVFLVCVSLGQEFPVVGMMEYFLYFVLFLMLLKLIMSRLLPPVPPNRLMAENLKAPLVGGKKKQPVRPPVDPKDQAATWWLEWKITITYLVIQVLLSASAGFLDISFCVTFMFKMEWSITQFVGFMTIVAGTSQIPALLRTLFYDSRGRKQYKDSSVLFVGVLLQIVGTVLVAYSFVVAAVIASVVGQVFTTVSIQALTSKILTSKRQSLINTIAFYIAPAVGIFLNIPFRPWVNPLDFHWLLLPLLPALGLCDLLNRLEWAEPDSRKMAQLRFENQENERTERFFEHESVRTGGTLEFSRLGPFQPISSNLGWARERGLTNASERSFVI